MPQFLLFNGVEGRASRRREPPVEVFVIRGWFVMDNVCHDGRRAVNRNEYFMDFHDGSEVRRSLVFNGSHFDVNGASVLGLLIVHRVGEVRNVAYTRWFCVFIHREESHR